ncbi:nucleotide-binding universal stress UspA family protein [Mucilaginibacter gracilis]|uniref:Nucleotide-binding universal stress UspA family protein n=1 Tax=Mucilaginibacter gracilis TaxID=423350 RepID=A0A495J3N7_9SPHI|nr:universal stress protein [Mucilaginibacter gracilis]RKR83590.1 nucleotide-binding universal stress UspA family protein [Mucilaginibacter gracilis]
MKTIIVPTDFSPAADNAARYALQLAKFINADVKLFNAAKVPANSLMALQTAWPVEDYQTIKTDVDHELSIFAKRLMLEQSHQNNVETHYKPKVTYCIQIGSVTDVTTNLAANHDVSLVVMGLKSDNAISRFLAGSISNDVIDKANFPLLLIPPAAKFKKLNTIAFATNLDDQEIDVIHSIVSLARQFNAELLLVHIMDDGGKQKDYRHKVSNFLTKVTNLVNYPHIYYRDVKSKDVDLGLTWLLDHRELEMLAMVHLKHDSFERLFNQSHTQHMARNADLPVLVFPAVNKSVVF